MPEIRSRSYSTAQILDLAPYERRGSDNYGRRSSFLTDWEPRRYQRRVLWPMNRWKKHVHRHHLAHKVKWTGAGMRHPFVVVVLPVDMCAKGGEVTICWVTSAMFCQGRTYGPLPFALAQQYGDREEARPW